MCQQFPKVYSFYTLARVSPFSPTKKTRVAATITTTLGIEIRYSLPIPSPCSRLAALFHLATSTQSSCNIRRRRGWIFCFQAHNIRFSAPPATLSYILVFRSPHPVVEYQKQRLAYHHHLPPHNSVCGLAYLWARTRSDISFRAGRLGSFKGGPLDHKSSQLNTALGPFESLCRKGKKEQKRATYLPTGAPSNHGLLPNPKHITSSTCKATSLLLSPHPHMPLLSPYV